MFGNLYVLAIKAVLLKRKYLIPEEKQTQNITHGNISFILIICARKAQQLGVSESKGFSTTFERIVRPKKKGEFEPFCNGYQAKASNFCV